MHVLAIEKLSLVFHKMIAYIVLFCGFKNAQHLVKGQEFLLNVIGMRTLSET